VLESRAPNLVGPGRFELPTSRLSSARSNQLSYEPGFLADHERDTPAAARFDRRLPLDPETRKPVPVASMGTSPIGAIFQKLGKHVSVLS
jgi:hypothetical protein